MKFAGKVGFWFKDVEIKPGIWGDNIVERAYTGDVSRAYHKWSENNESTLDNLRLNNQISIVGDQYLQQNWSSIKYVLWNGVYWKVNTIGISFPRLTLEIGGIWNGPTEASTGAAESS